MGSLVHHVATGYTSTCSKEEHRWRAFMWTTSSSVSWNGASLTTSISIGSGKHNTVVEGVGLLRWSNPLADDDHRQPLECRLGEFAGEWQAGRLASDWRCDRLHN